MLYHPEGEYQRKYHTQKIKRNQMQDFWPIIWSPDPCLNSSGSLTHIFELRTPNRPTQGGCPCPQDAPLGCPGEVPAQYPELSVCSLTPCLPTLNRCGLGSLGSRGIHLNWLSYYFSDGWASECTSLGLSWNSWAFFNLETWKFLIGCFHFIH